MLKTKSLKGKTSSNNGSNNLIFNSLTKENVILLNNIPNPIVFSRVINSKTL